MKKLPHSKFEWMKTLPSVEDILAHDPEGSTGCFLEVDTEVPPEMHDYLNDLPVFPNKMDVTEEHLSELTKEIRRKKFGECRTTTSTKLAPNLLPQTKYVCHIAALKMYLQLGGRITKIHRGLQFHQSDWLKPYISVSLVKNIDFSSFSEKEKKTTTKKQ